MTSECEEEKLETDDSSIQNDKISLSLLSFADMALALEAHKHEKDHTYAMHEHLCAEVEITDSERLVNKERDHNYSYFSKTLQPRGRGSKVNTQFRTEPRRSSSEENLNRSTATVDKISSHDFPVSSVSRKSHSLEKMTSHSSELSDVLFRAGFPGFSGLVVSSESEENLLSGKILGSSWPKETGLETRKTRKKDYLSAIQMNISPSYCDHTYARELAIQNNSCKSQNNSYKHHDCPDVNSVKTLRKSDHTYFDFSQRKSCGCDFSNKTNFKVESDHNYTVADTATDSDDNKFSTPWIPLRRDHTYSIF